MAKSRRSSIRIPVVGPDDGSQDSIPVQDFDLVALMKQLLKQQQITNLHLAKLSGEEITINDIGD